MNPIEGKLLKGVGRGAFFNSGSVEILYKLQIRGSQNPSKLRIASGLIFIFGDFYTAFNSDNYLNNKRQSNSGYYGREI
ncbi:MAG: hypothetical protein ABH854_04955 [Candidatus Diapherotrites archaeon]